MRGGWLRISPAADLVKNGGLSMKHAGLSMNDGGLTLLSQWNSDYSTSTRVIHLIQNLKNNFWK